MKTEIIRIDKSNIELQKIEKAACFLKQGELVAFPTETVYGLGADALDADAASKIYTAKGRPSDNPLIVHIADFAVLDKLACNITDETRKIIEEFWPGPLTVVLHKREIVPMTTTGGLNTVAVRMPSHPVALSLLERSGLCVAAPSANTSGRPSPTSADHVKQDMNGKIAAIVDGGEVGIGVESTILDLTGDTPVILRPGFITKEMIEQVIHREVLIDPAILKMQGDGDAAPKAPGMKYKHYAPKGEMTIVAGTSSRAIADKINELAEEKIRQGYQVGIIASEENILAYPKGNVKNIGKREDEHTVAARLYKVLRELDDEQSDFIYSEAFSEEGIGKAIMNRLLKAAGYHVIQV